MSCVPWGNETERADYYKNEYGRCYKELQKYEDAEKQGLLVKLPCKMDNDILDTAKVIFEEWNNVSGVVPERTSWYWELESVIEDIVKLSFGAGVLYKQEAEAALKARDKSDRQ